MSDPIDTERNLNSELKSPTMVDALIPVVALIGLIALSVYLFGLDSTSGPLQIAIFTAMAIAGLIAHKNGYAYTELSTAVIGGISSAMGAIFILLAVGALIGTWNMAGTIPTIVDYGLQILSPSWFYFAVAIICAVTGSVTGSSWTTAGTLGVAFVGIAHILGVSPEITAGAVISGSYFGDKMSPLSETTILTPSLVGGVTTGEHIRAMFWTTGPSFAIALVIFLGISLTEDSSSSSVDIESAQATLRQAFNISAVNLLPLAVLIAFSIIKFPAFLSIFLTAIFSGVLACFTQYDQVIKFANDPELSPPFALIKGIYSAMGTGYVSNSGVESIDTLFFRRRHERHAHDGLADSWRARLRRDHGTGRIPRQAGPGRTCEGQVRRHAGSDCHWHGDRTEHHRGRSVHRNRVAFAHLPARVQAPWLQAARAISGR